MLIRFLQLCLTGILFGMPVVAQIKKEVPPKYWSELHDTAKTNLKSNPKVNKNAVLYLDGKFFPIKDSLSRRMLLDITMPTELGLPLNFFVFNGIVKQHEKEVDEMMGEFCRRMVASHPDYTFQWLYAQKEKKNELWKLYAKYVGEQSSPKEYQNFTDFLSFYFGSGGKAGARQMSDLIIKESGKFRKK